MSGNSKPAAEGSATGSQVRQQRYRNNNKRPPKTQPGTALTAFLKMYKFDLLSLPCDAHISRLVDCCDVILDEVGGC